MLLSTLFSFSEIVPEERPILLFYSFSEYLLNIYWRLHTIKICNEEKYSSCLQRGHSVMLRIEKHYNIKYKVLGAEELALNRKEEKGKVEERKLN